jgi:hypothetical protein
MSSVSADWKMWVGGGVVLLIVVVGIMMYLSRNTNSGKMATQIDTVFAANQAEAKVDAAEDIVGGKGMNVKILAPAFPEMDRRAEEQLEPSEFIGQPVSSDVEYFPPVPAGGMLDAMGVVEEGNKLYRYQSPATDEGVVHAYFHEKKEL